MTLTIRKDDIPAGQGRYYPGELGKTHGVAVFRDREGRVRVFSSDCPHRHCSVVWDATLSRWGCPCHGSAFGAEDGKVQKGPAVSGLTPLPFEDRGEVILVEPV